MVHLLRGPIRYDWLSSSNGPALGAKLGFVAISTRLHTGVQRIDQFNSFHFLDSGQVHDSHSGRRFDWPAQVALVLGRTQTRRLPAL